MPESEKTKQMAPPEAKPFVRVHRLMLELFEEGVSFTSMPASRKPRPL
jgi:hypothetical protein